MTPRGIVRDLIGVASIALAPPLLALQRRRGVAPILVYHRVSPRRDPIYEPQSPDVFDAHCAFLRRHFDVLPLLELVRRVLAGTATRGACAICFDDGYRDFADHALPILLSHALPVTHFLVADCVETGLPPWTYRFRRVAAQRGWTDPLARDTYGQVARMDAQRRGSWLSQEEVSCAGQLPSMLGELEIRGIDDERVEWGSHTCSHGFLDRLTDREVVREVAESKARLERITRIPIRLLAYPNGYHSPCARDAARESGYVAALTVQGAPFGPSSPGFAIPRFDVGGHPTRMLQLEVTGALSMLRRLRPS